MDVDCFALFNMEKKGRKREQMARTEVEVFFGTVVVGGAGELVPGNWGRQTGRETLAGGGRVQVRCGAAATNADNRGIESS